MKPNDQMRIVLVTYFWALLFIAIAVIVDIAPLPRKLIDSIPQELFPALPNGPFFVDTYIDVTLALVFFLLPGLYFRYLRLSEAAQAIALTLVFQLTGTLAAIYFWGIILPLFYPLLAIFVGTLTGAFLRLIASTLEQEFLRKAFSQYVSEDMLRDLLKHPDKLSLQGKECDIAVLFLDIRGFTTYSENHSAQLVVNRLNELLEIVTKIIIAHHGTVDKYIGDSVMAFWGAPPVWDKKPVTNALAAAIEIRKKIETDTEFSVGIGINYGSAIVGNVGSSKRYDYTVIGDTVNTAARLEGATKELERKILISQAVIARSHEEHLKVETESLGTYRLKGKSAPIRIYTIVD